MKLNNKFALLLAGAMLVGALTGCGASGTPASSAASSEAAASSAVSEAASEPAAEAALPDGVYTADFDTDSSMFHANEANDGKGTLTVKDGQMTFHVSLVSKKIVNLYVGMAADAEAHEGDWLQPTTDTVTYSDGLSDEVYGFDIPVKALDEDFQLAILGSKGKWYDRVIDTLTGIFTPILPPLTAAGMIKAVLAILVAFKLVSNTSSTYQVINFMGDATFYFLPILLANSAAKKLGCNPYLAMMLGGILIHPSFVNLVAASKESGEAITIFMLPIYNASYSSSVIPIILGVLLMSKVEPWATRISPKAIRFFTAPLLTMFICGIATLCVLGPVGYVVSNALAAVINGLSTLAPCLWPTSVGLFLPFLVMTGTHHALTPIGINNRMTIGFDTIIYPGQLASNVAQGAAALAVSIKTKDPELKQLTSATGITAVCGITEPVLFGVTMKIRTNMIAAMAGGGVGGFFMGLMDTKNDSGGSPGLLNLPSYIGLDTPMSNFYYACAGAAIAFVVAFIVSFVLFRDEKKN